MPPRGRSPRPAEEDRLARVGAKARSAHGCWIRVRATGRTTWAARERGRGACGYSTVEVVIVIPAIVAMTLVLLQVTLAWHGRHVAEAAARQGLAAARDYGGTDGEGRQQSLAFLHTVAPRLLTDTHVDVTRGPATVSVRVRAQVITVIPGLSPRVDEVAAGPLEQFKAPA